MQMTKTVFLAAAFAGCATFVQAQACLPRDAIVASLSDSYSENLKGRGLKDETNLYEFFVTKDGATWTILQTYPNGMSCIIAAGEHWMESDTPDTPEGVKG